MTVLQLQDEVATMRSSHEEQTARALELKHQVIAEISQPDFKS